MPLISATAKSPMEVTDAAWLESGGLTRRAHFAAGETIFEKGAPRDSAFIIDQGEVRILDPAAAGEKDLCLLGAGEIFGEMALVDEGPRTATARAAKDTDVFVISRAALDARMQGLDPLINLLISLLVERYRTARVHLPESIKADENGDLAQKIARHGHVPEHEIRIPDMERRKEDALRELKLEQEIRHALERGEFVPYLQPILELPSLRINGFEALIRWNHPERGVVAPAAFVPVAERTGLIQLIDRMMLEKACRVIPDLNEALLQSGVADGRNPVFVSVNLSGINFGAADVVGVTREVLEKCGIDPRMIRLEITESALVRDPAHAEAMLKGLRALGLNIALDDFGTGYSSLGYLHRFPIDTIKIDRSFVCDLHTNSRSMDIVRAIVGLARNFKMTVVAEGIERDEELMALAGIGCDMGQGYLFGRPMDIETALDFARRNLEFMKDGV